MNKSHDFSQAIEGVKIPPMVLDQKWHRLFALGGKPDEVKQLEDKVNELMRRQAELRQEYKELKKVKDNLMESVVSNMEDTADEVSKKLDDDKRLLEECNQRIEANEAEAEAIPNQITETNKNLLIASMEYCYDKLRTNSREANEITEWIKNVRVQLKKNVIRKQNREINNKEIYAYMHDVFGKEILDIFDITHDDFSLGFLDDSDTEELEDKEVKGNPDIPLEEIDLEAIENEKG